MKKSPFRIFLLNMPFASLNLPSLALTQLHAVLDNKYRDLISVNTVYINLDFVDFIGGTRNYYHALSAYGQLTGLGDWFFRQSAFPEPADNSEEYLARFYFSQDEQTKAVRRFTREKRAGLDCFLDKLITKHGLDEANLVGFTSLFAQNTANFAIARKLKERNPNIITVMGGSACEGITGRNFSEHVKQIDFFFSGPALISFPEFVKHCINGEMEKCDRINGVFSKTSAQPECVGILGDDLDINVNIDLDYTTFLDAFEKSFPSNEIKPILLFETSRGCWWGQHTSCTFCGLNGLSRHYRVMSPEKALLQFESLFRFSSRCSYLINVDNVMPKHYLQEVFPYLNTPHNMKIRYEVRPDLSAADIRTLCRAGINVIQPGIESLSTPTLKLMRKGVTAFDNVRFLKDCSVNAISLEWNLLIGTPGESEETFLKCLHDIPIMTHLPPPDRAFPVEFVRYSHYFDHVDQYGLNLRPHDFCGMTFPYNKKILSNIARRFVDDNADQEYISRWLDRINEKIVFWRTRWLNQDKKVEAKLCFVRDAQSSFIYDSRSGEVIQHKISDVAMSILEYLAKPGSIKDIIAALSDIPHFEAEREVVSLNKLGLLFREGERFLSLVVSE